ncbi:MAG: hypothetical protein ACOCTT_02595 [archaeon]
MILNNEEKKFIAQNADILRSIFKRRFEELMESVLNKDELTENEKVELKFMREYKAWLKTIGILEGGQFKKESKNKESVKNKRI